MVTVKMFGTLRLKTGIKEMEIPPGRISRYFDAIMAEAAPDCEASVKDLKDCIIILNGKQAGYHSVAKDGDQVMFLSPSGGG